VSLFFCNWIYQTYLISSYINWSLHFLFFLKQLMNMFIVYFHGLASSFLLWHIYEYVVKIIVCVLYCVTANDDDNAGDLTFFPKVQYILDLMQ